MIRAFWPFVQEPYCHGGGGVYVTVQSDVGDAVGVAFDPVNVGGKEVVAVAVALGKTGGAEVVAVGNELGKLGGSVAVGSCVCVIIVSFASHGGGFPVLLQ